MDNTNTNNTNTNINNIIMKSFMHLNWLYNN